jgi:hypothetical protein
LTGLTIDQVKARLAQATGLSPEVLSSIFLMKQRGLSLELISQESDVELEVLKQFLPQIIKKTVEAHAVADKGKGPFMRSALTRELTRLALLTTTRPTADHTLRRLKRPNSSHNPPRPSPNLSTVTSLPSTTAAKKPQTSWIG